MPNLHQQSSGKEESESHELIHTSLILPVNIHGFLCQVKCKSLPGIEHSQICPTSNLNVEGQRCPSFVMCCSYSRGGHRNMTRDEGASNGRETPPQLLSNEATRCKDSPTLNTVRTQLDLKTARKGSLRPVYTKTEIQQEAVELTRTPSPCGHSEPAGCRQWTSKDVWSSERGRVIFPSPQNAMHRCMSTGTRLNPSLPWRFASALKSNQCARSPNWFCFSTWLLPAGKGDGKCIWGE